MGWGLQFAMPSGLHELAPHHHEGRMSLTDRSSSINLGDAWCWSAIRGEDGGLQPGVKSCCVGVAHRL